MQWVKMGNGAGYDVSGVPGVARPLRVWLAPESDTVGFVLMVKIDGVLMPPTDDEMWAFLDAFFEVDGITLQ